MVNTLFGNDRNSRRRGGSPKPMNHADIVRTAYERFNDKDFDAVLVWFGPDAELWDTLKPGAVIRGRDAIRELWTARFDSAAAHFVVDELLEMGDVVLASVHFQAYTQNGASFGRQVHALYRFTFRDDLVVSLEARPLDEVPDSTRALFGVA